MDRADVRGATACTNTCSVWLASIRGAAGTAGGGSMPRWCPCDTCCTRIARAVATSTWNGSRVTLRPAGSGFQRGCCACRRFDAIRAGAVFTRFGRCELRRPERRPLRRRRLPLKVRKRSEEPPALTFLAAPRYKESITSFARSPSALAELARRLAERRYRLGVRTPDSQSGNPGSIPGTATKSPRSWALLPREVGGMEERNRDHGYLQESRPAFRDPVVLAGEYLLPDNHREFLFP